MKSFIYKTTFKNASYGQKVTNTVYQIKRGRPVLIGETTYNTGSYRGHDHEAMQLIIDNKLLPANCMDRPSRGYINFDKLNKVFQLYSV